MTMPAFSRWLKMTMPRLVGDLRWLCLRLVGVLRWLCLRLVGVLIWLCLRLVGVLDSEERFYHSSATHIADCAAMNESEAWVSVTRYILLSQTIDLDILLLSAHTRRRLTNYSSFDGIDRCLDVDHTNIGPSDKIVKIGLTLFALHVSVLLFRPKMDCPMD
jgi:hypothetical protein